MKPGQPLGPSQIRKWSIVLNGTKTSISLEPAFRQVLIEMAGGLDKLPAMIGNMHPRRSETLSSHLRLAALAYVRERAKARLTPAADPV